jgi:hypothetical protein
LWYGMLLLIFVLPPLTFGLLRFGDSSVRGVGIGLAFVTLVVYAVPVTPILRARVRRREAHARQGE